MTSSTKKEEGPMNDKTEQKPQDSQEMETPSEEPQPETEMLSAEDDVLEEKEKLVTL